MELTDALCKFLYTVNNEVISNFLLHVHVSLAFIA